MNKQAIEITQEVAESLLSKRAIVIEAGIFEEPITVGNVSFGKVDPETGEVIEKFYWENADGTPNLERPYAIVNLQAMTEEQFAKAEEFLEAGEFEKAVGKEAGGLSMRMNVDEVIKAGLTRGSVVKCTFNHIMNREGDDILGCTAIAPMIARGGANRFKQARIEAQKAKQEALKQKAQSEKAQAEQENA